MDATENPRFKEFMTIIDKYRKMGVRTNAETPEDAIIARKYGAEGIGLFRTEQYVLTVKDQKLHYFFLEK